MNRRAQLSLANCPSARKSETAVISSIQFHWFITKQKWRRQIEKRKLRCGEAACRGADSRLAHFNSLHSLVYTSFLFYPTKNSTSSPSDLRNWPTANRFIEILKYELCWGNWRLYYGALFRSIGVSFKADWAPLSWWRRGFSWATLSKFSGRLIRTAVTTSIIFSQRRLVYNASYFGILKRFFQIFSFRD